MASLFCLPFVSLLESMLKRITSVGVSAASFMSASTIGFYDLFILDKVVHRLSIPDLTVFQKVGQDFQEVRFTASKEAGNPHAHLWCCFYNPFL